MSALRKHSLAIYKWALAAAVSISVVLPWYVFLFVIFGGETGMELMPGYWFPLLVYLGAVGWELGVNPENDPNPRRRRTLSLLAGVAGALGLAYLLIPASLKADLKLNDFVLAVGVTATFLWLQGTRNAYEGLEYSALYSKLPWQMVICVLGIVVASSSGATAMPGVTAAMIVAVATLVVGFLMLLMVTREEELRQGQQEMGDAAGNAPVRPWLGVSVLAILGMGMLSSTFMTSPWFRQGLATMQGWFSSVYEFLFAVASLILVRWFQLLEFMTKYPMMQMGNEAEADLEMVPEDPTDIPQLVMAEPETLEKYFNALIFFVTAVIIGLVLYKMSGHANRRRRSGGEEERHSLGVLDNLLADMKAMFTRKVREVQAAIAEKRLDPSDPRAIYRRLQNWGEQKGRPRGVIETEGAYQGALVKDAHAPDEEVSTITALYQQVRYAEESASQEQIAEALRAADQLEQEKKRSSGSGKE